MVYSEESVRLLADKAFLGEKMAQFRDEPFIFFKENILDDIENEALKDFQSIDPSDSGQVTEIQKIFVVIKLISQKIHDKISDGQLAREELKALNEEFEQ